MHRDVHDASLDRRSAELLHKRGEPFRHHDTARRDADNGEGVDGGISLDDLVRDPLQHTVDGGCVQQQAGGGAWRCVLAHCGHPWDLSGSCLKAPAKFIS